MFEKRVTIKNQLGLHARPAALLVRTAEKFKSNIFVVKGDLEVNGKSIMGVMMLAAEMGSQITIRAEGEDEKEAVEAIASVVEDKFYEE
ncbi:MAG: phosphocarrier protein HPr [Candidatus Latescibacterota bacterium]|nr:MAG: phosphocarrier protein HPr [Candidatus Latescibacterota bacterium]RKY71717.1 MAG: phosphocarrier protein HPr [Candidatus Latescibacterota bacterium]